MDILRVIVATGSGPQATDFTGPGQQDAAEFLQALLACLREEVDLRGKLLLRKLFESRVLETRTCCLQHVYDCPPREKRLSTYPDLVSIPVSGCRSLVRCLAIFHGMTHGLVSLRCGAGACPSEDAEFSSRYCGELPGAMMFQLKRTVPDSQATPGTMKKLGHKVKIPARIRPQPGGPVYILTGALNQLGEEANTGHYVSITRDLEHGHFILADDHRPLRKMTDKEVSRFLTTSYMFVYCREDHLQGTSGWLEEEVVAVVGSEEEEEAEVVGEEEEGHIDCGPCSSPPGNGNIPDTDCQPQVVSICSEMSASVVKQSNVPHVHVDKI